jgi:hypothetical protein
MFPSCNLGSREYSLVLVESAHSWWETIRERRSGEVLRWRDFHEEFEERYYSWKHRKEKEQV